MGRRGALPDVWSIVARELSRRPCAPILERWSNGNPQWPGALRDLQSREGQSVNLKLRPWQQDALAKAVKWLVEDRVDRHFLINAAPAAGKTLASCAIAKVLMDRGEIDRVIVIAP